MVVLAQNMFLIVSISCVVGIFEHFRWLYCDLQFLPAMTLKVSPRVLAWNHGRLLSAHVEWRESKVWLRLSKAYFVIHRIDDFDNRL